MKIYFAILIILVEVFNMYGVYFKDKIESNFKLIKKFEIKKEAKELIKKLKKSIISNGHNKYKIIGDK